MTITRFRLRLCEAIALPLMLIVVDGALHLYLGWPFMTEFLWGGSLCGVCSSEHGCLSRVGRRVAGGLK
jgi:hypothetical protein